jgi:hypothetical protein
LCFRGNSAGVHRHLRSRFVFRQPTDTLHRRSNGLRRADFRHSADGAETRTRVGVGRHGDWSAGRARPDEIDEESALSGASKRSRNVCHRCRNFVRGSALGLLHPGTPGCEGGSVGGTEIRVKSLPIADCHCRLVRRVIGSGY